MSITLIFDAFSKWFSHGAPSTPDDKLRAQVTAVLKNIRVAEMLYPSTRDVMSSAFGLFGRPPRSGVTFSFLPAFTFDGILSGQYSIADIETKIPDNAGAMRAARAAHIELDRIVKKAARMADKPEGLEFLKKFVGGMREVMAVRHGIDNPEIFEVMRDSVSSKFLRAFEVIERVHPIMNGHDLLMRIGSKFTQARGKLTRAVYGWKDPYDPDGALITIQAALVNHDGISDNIQTIKAGGDKIEGTIDSAVFYTVSSWERVALALGRPFIDSVVKFVRETRPQIKHFYTLSPMPGFRAWVSKLDEKEWHECGAARLLGMPLEEFRKNSFFDMLPGEIRPYYGEAGIHTPAPPSDEQKKQFFAFQSDMQKLAAVYLTGRFDPVAKFHLGNGARIERINPDGNNSARGWQESWGLMVNYRYSPEDMAPRFEGGSFETYQARYDTKFQENLRRNRAANAGGDPARAPAIDRLLMTPVAQRLPESSMVPA